jgi:protein-S-isoprenylcysteine O-methyltransferase Ste14
VISRRSTPPGAIVRIVTLSVCLLAFASFGWGVLRFFTKPSGLTRRAAVVAVLGLCFSVWNLLGTWVWPAGTPALLAAAGLYVAAAALFWSAARACPATGLTAIYETDAPRTLVRGGPYRFVRHPFYTSYTLYWIGGAVGSASWVSAAAVIVMAAIYTHAARGEERKFAASTLARDYDDYKRR